MDKYKLLIIILDPVLFTGCVILQQQKKVSFLPRCGHICGSEETFSFLLIYI